MFPRLNIVTVAVVEFYGPQIVARKWNINLICCLSTLVGSHMFCDSSISSLDLVTIDQYGKTYRQTPCNRIQ